MDAISIKEKCNVLEKNDGLPAAQFPPVVPPLLVHSEAV